MKHDDFEKDALWDLLRQSPGPAPRPSFVNDVVRAARLSPPEKPWWRRVLIPLAFGGVPAAAAAVVVLTLTMQQQQPGAPAGAVSAPVAVVTKGDPAALENFQDFAASQMLSVAADNLSDYSNDELVSLVGF